MESMKYVLKNLHREGSASVELPTCRYDDI